MSPKRGEVEEGERVEWSAVRVSSGQVKCGASEKKKEKKEAIPVGVEPTIFRSGGECVSTAPQDHPWR